jgi:hypothetical protein
LQTHRGQCISLVMIRQRVVPIYCPNGCQWYIPSPNTNLITEFEVRRFMSLSFRQSKFAQRTIAMIGRQGIAAGSCTSFNQHSGHSLSILAFSGRHIHACLPLSTAMSFAETYHFDIFCASAAVQSKGYCAGGISWQ